MYVNNDKNKHEYKLIFQCNKSYYHIVYLLKPT